MLEKNLIHEVTSRLADEIPDSVAVKYLAPNTDPVFLTRKNLQQRIDSVTAAVQQRIGVGERALLLYSQGLDFVAAFLGCLQAGVIAVPAYPPRRNRSQHRLLGIVKNCLPKVILTTADIMPNVTTDLAGGAEILATDSLPISQKMNALPELASDDIAYLQYTSGSTSEPKGTIITHGAVVQNILHLTSAVGLRDNWNVVSWLPMHHDMGLVGTVLSPLYLGGRTTLLSPTTFLQNPFLWLKAFTTERGNFSASPNFGFDHCCKMIRDEELTQLDLSSIRLIVNGSEPLRAETIDRFTKRFGSCGFSPEKMFPSYGLAEATLFVTGGPYGAPARRIAVDPTTSEPDSSSKNVKWTVGCGASPPSIRVVIVDAETQTSCPEGKIGQVWVQSRANGSGYWGNAELSRQTFQNFLACGDGPFLNTGDLGFLLSGELYVTGRAKDLIILRGRNLYPQDIERAAESVLPFIETNACAAVSVPGTNDEQLALVIEANRELVRVARKAKSDSTADDILRGHVESLRRAIGEEFETTLHRIAFMQPGTFPRTSSGKVQRHRCLDAFQEGNTDVVYQWQQTSNKGSTSANPARTSSSEKTDALIQWLREYAPRRINSRIMDERRCIPPYVVLDFGNHGLFGLQAPESLGGLGLTTQDMLRVMQQLAAIDPTLAAMVGLHNGLGMRPLLKFADESLHQELVPPLATGRQLAAFALTEPGAGSNSLAMDAIAQQVQGGWRLTAEKRWIGMASWAGCITVFARSIDVSGVPGGIIALNVQEDAAGVRQGRESLTMGMRAIVQNTIYFDDVFVPDERVLGKPGEGMTVAQDAMMLCRLGIAAMCIGGMKRCAQLMLRYGERRNVATGRLLDNPVTLARLENLSAAIEATQALTESIADWIDAGLDVPVEAYVACKTSAPEYFSEAADNLMQLLGGRGYIETNVAPQLLRDARVLRIFEGPTETLRMFLGANVVQCPEVIYKLLADNWHSANVATALEDVVEQLGRSMDGDARVAPVVSPGSSPDRKQLAGTRQWLHYQIGEIATAAILWAASAHHHSLGRIDGSASSWAAQQFDRLCESALSERSRPRVPKNAEKVSNRIRDLLTSIGDIQQDLPGEDDQMDDYLRQQWPADTSAIPTGRSKTVSVRAMIVGTDDRSLSNGDTTPASPTGLTPENELAKTLHRLVLKWVQDELDDSVKSISEDAPFSTLGIDSVGAAIIALDLQKATGVSITADLLYQFPTIHELASYLSKQQTGYDKNPAESGGMHPSMAVRSPSSPEAIATAPPQTKEEPGANTQPLTKTSEPCDFADRNQVSQRMKAAGVYFYGTSYSAVDGTHVTVDGRRMLMLASFAYTGLIGHPEVNAATKKAIDDLGAGCHGVRLIAGTTSVHRELEQQLAKFVQADDALLFSSGYATNVATIPALVGPGDSIFADEYNHASLVDGCKLSGASFEIFPHNQVDGLEKLLKNARAGRRLVIVDGVYSMEGDIAPLPEIIDLCRRYHAMLMVDEAHSLGVIGKTGRGVQEHFGLSPDAIDIKMGNTSKSLASLGGFIAGKQPLIDYLRHNARGYVFSTSLGPPQVAAALKALEILEREPNRVVCLQRNAQRLTRGLREAGFQLAATESAIVPLLCRSTDHALAMTASCRNAGLFVIPIVYPAVPMNAPRLRLNVMASHTDEEIDWAISVLVKAGREVGIV